MRLRRLLALVVLLASAVAIAPRAATFTLARGAAQEYGPHNGTLVIAGGSTEGLILPIYDKFIELAGGVDGRFVIVPTAMAELDESGDQVLRFWRNRGLKNVTMLHTRDPKIANTAAFAGVLSDATAVWFTGGRHHRIVDAYAGTLTFEAFHKVLARGGVIGGNSAGATIQGEYLVRGDSRGPHIVMTGEKHHQRGFGFLRRSAIDQHIDARNRWDDLIPVIRKYPGLLGIGLSEDTAIIVKGDQSARRRRYLQHEDTHDREVRENNDHS